MFENEFKTFDELVKLIETSDKEELARILNYHYPMKHLICDSIERYDDSNRVRVKSYSASFVDLKMRKLLSDYRIFSGNLFWEKLHHDTPNKTIGIKIRRQIIRYIRAIEKCNNELSELT